MLAGVGVGVGVWQYLVSTLVYMHTPSPHVPTYNQLTRDWNLFGFHPFLLTFPTMPRAPSRFSRSSRSSPLFSSSLLFSLSPRLLGCGIRHHESYNPDPWSGLSMHPVEHLIYFSAALVTAIVAPLWVVRANVFGQYLFIS